MSTRDPFVKCLGSVVSMMKPHLPGALLLEYLPSQNAAQFLLEGRAFLVVFSEGALLLTPFVFEYDAQGKRTLLDGDPFLPKFYTAHKNALHGYLQRVAKSGNTDHLCESYSAYFLANYPSVMAA